MHTPGPWTIDPSQPECWARIRADGDEPIADVFGLDRDDDADEADANARLIAAAPETLKALEAKEIVLRRRNNENDRLREALLDIIGHGVTLPVQTAINMTEEEKRWYARGIDSQRKIAKDALEDLKAWNE